MSSTDKTKLDGIAASANNYTHPVSGVTAGTYKSVTVDINGHVTSGTNPTTLAGYGITDAQALDADLTAIATLSGTSGLLKKTAANTWSLDTNTYITGNQNIVVSGDASGSGTTSIALTLANSGATAGTYKSVTVDAKGRVTAGTNPTTLAGYGITDAAPSTHVGATGTAHGVATTSVAGFMSAADKTKLDGISGTPLTQTSGVWTPTVGGNTTNGTWTPSGTNVVEWVKTGKIVNYNVIVSGTLTGAAGVIKIKLPAAWGAQSANQELVDTPCQGWSGFTTEVKGMITVNAVWESPNNYFLIFTQSNTSPWTRSVLPVPAGNFSLEFSGTIILA